MIYLDVVTQHLAMSLGTSLAQSLASFASSSHSEVELVAVDYWWMMLYRSTMIFYQPWYLFVIKVYHKML